MSSVTYAAQPELHDSWMKVTSQELLKPYMKELFEFVTNERKKHKIYPSIINVFSWSNLCPFDRVKVVILGQDPYHEPNQAHGLAFSVEGDVKIPPTLLNIYKELETDIEGFVRPTHGNLTSWAEQGVLLLNTVLTVRHGQANSHAKKGWETFTDHLIQVISSSGKKPVVFILWGKPAAAKEHLIDKENNHCLVGAHPSPLSAYKGFFGCKHFSQTNELLKKAGRYPIDWKKVCSVKRKGSIDSFFGPSKKKSEGNRSFARISSNVTISDEKGSPITT